MITIVARNILNPGAKKAFIEATRRLIEESRKEQGNIAYDLYEDTDDPQAMCFIERWHDAAAIERHNASQHFKEWIDRKPELVASGEVVKYRML